jgi:ribosomal protein S18 acetylase RimI-like enzyme
VSNGDIILGAFDKVLVGIVSITRNLNLKRQHKAYLHGMYVVPEYRGLGLGKTLLVKSLEMARNMVSLEEIQLVVAVHNRSVVALYENFGFVHSYKESRALKTDDGYIDAYHMRLSIQR